MGAVHFHLLTAHLPFLGMAFSLLLFLIGAVLRSRQIQRIALFFIILTVLATITVYFSGKSAKDTLIASDLLSEDQITDHAATALTAFVTILIIGVLAVGGMLKRSPSDGYPNWFLLMMLILLVISIALSAGTVNVGLKLRHSELLQTQPETITLPDSDTT